MFKRFGAFFLDTLQVILFAVAIFLFVYLLILQPHKIKGQSMEPNFKNAEFLLTDKVTYRFNDPQRGDVVIFKAPPDDKEEFIKRIIGLPGDTVSVQNGHFLVNGKLLDESSYLASSVVTAEGAFTVGGKTVTVPENSYFVSGDNRPNSFDSRAFGFIERNKITGRAWFVYWPPQAVGVIQPVGY